MRTIQMTLDEELVELVDKIGSLLLILSPERLKEVREAIFFHLIYDASLFKTGAMNSAPREN